MHSPSRILPRVFPWRSALLARNSVLSEFTMTSEFDIGVKPIHNQTVQHRETEQTRPTTKISYTSPHAIYPDGTPDPSSLRGCGCGLSHSVGPDPDPKANLGTVPRFDFQKGHLLRSNSKYVMTAGTVQGRARKGVIPCRIRSRKRTPGVVA